MCFIKLSSWCSVYHRHPFKYIVNVSHFRQVINVSQSDYIKGSNDVNVKLNTIN